MHTSMWKLQETLLPGVRVTHKIPVRAKIWPKWDTRHREASLWLMWFVYFIHTSVQNNMLSTIPNLDNYSIFLENRMKMGRTPHRMHFKPWTENINPFDQFYLIDRIMCKNFNSVVWIPYCSTLQGFLPEETKVPIHLNIPQNQPIREAPG